MANTLFLRLEAPLQSWGERGRWSVRDTAAEPTKSGVIGLLACALGYREDAAIRPLSEKTRMGVRIDAPGRVITDYHTVGGGYETPQLLQADGKPKQLSGRPHTELSSRDYLCDASFLVALQVRDGADESLVDRWAAALRNPVWPPFLGRKACVPARPLLAGTGTYDDLLAALTDHAPFSTYDRGPDDLVTLRMVLESDEPLGLRRRDQLHSRRYRVFHPRYVTAPAPHRFKKKEEDGDVFVALTA